MPRIPLVLFIFAVAAIAFVEERHINCRKWETVCYRRGGCVRKCAAFAIPGTKGVEIRSIEDEGVDIGENDAEEKAREIDEEEERSFDDETQKQKSRSVDGEKPVKMDDVDELEARDVDDDDVDELEANFDDDANEGELVERDDDDDVEDEDDDSSEDETRSIHEFEEDSEYAVEEVPRYIEESDSEEQEMSIKTKSQKFRG